MNKSAAVFVLLSLSITLSIPALGQKQQAKILFDKGVLALEKKNFRVALDAFTNAYEMSPHWAVLAHIGTCHANLNQPLKAIEALEQYLIDGGDNVPNDEKETAKAIIAEQRRKVGILVLSVEKTGVEAMVDGEAIGISPFKEKLVMPGTHEVAIVFGENDIVKRSVDIEAGQEYLLRIEQEQHLPVAPPPPTTPEPTKETAPPKDTTEKELPTSAFNYSLDDHAKEGSLAPFFISLGVTVASAALAGVGWGFYTHYKMSETNFADYLNELKSEDEDFENYSWDTTCQSIELLPKPHYYCTTEYNRQEFEKKADKWFIVGIAGSSATVVAGALTIVFYIFRDRFGDNSANTASLHVSPYLSAKENGLNLSISF